MEGEEQIRLAANPLKWQAVTRACVTGLESLNPRANRSIAAPVSAVPRVAPATRHGRILVAEDHPVSQALIRRQLELLGWSCDVVGDGRAACEALCANRYAMLLTDCQMPLMSGYDLATAWRRHENENGGQHRMPIVAMTASALDGEAARCRDAGMDDCLNKPLQLRQLQEKIEAWMPPAAASSPPGIDPVLAAGTPAAESAPNQDMLQVLLETSRTDLHRLDLAIANGDPTTAAQRLHRLLGALQWFSDAPAIAEGRQWLEALEADDNAATLQKLPACIDALRNVLADLGQASGK